MKICTCKDVRSWIYADVSCDDVSCHCFCYCFCRNRSLKRALENEQHSKFRLRAEYFRCAFSCEKVIVMRLALKTLQYHAEGWPILHSNHFALYFYEICCVLNCSFKTFLVCHHHATNYAATTELPHVLFAPLCLESGHSRLSMSPQWQLPEPLVQCHPKIFQPHRRFWIKGDGFRASPSGLKA